MSKKNPEEDKKQMAAEDALSQIRQKFGEGAIMKLGGSQHHEH